MPQVETTDALVIGGGVIGLSIAYELACDGVDVTLLERGQIGREASWAGAGILPPASWYEPDAALDALALDAANQQPRWSERLQADTGINDEYWRCGATYLATPTNATYLAAAAARWRALGVDLVDDGPNGFTAPTEAQVRNPRRIRALHAACEQRGVRVRQGVLLQRFAHEAGDKLQRVETSAGDFVAGAYCMAAGCWTPALAGVAGSVAPGRPVRGQMLLLRPRRADVSRIIHRYPHYAVPRRDGRVLVGATVEEAGFDKRTTGAARDALLTAAAEISPCLAGAEVERQWSGLRPASADALPLIGRAPNLTNLWIASGHHRSGLQLAPPTARMISAMIRGLHCGLPAEPFDPARFAVAPQSGSSAVGKTVADASTCI